MLLPSIFGENLFDDMMNFDFDKEFERMPAVRQTRSEHDEDRCPRR